MQGQGVDQVQEVIDTIRNEPESRRIILTAWNPAALKEMALPPCHMTCQFFVDPKAKELSCTLYQRSADWGLGIPFNIASYSLLTMIIAQVSAAYAEPASLAAHRFEGKRVCARSRKRTCLQESCGTLEGALRTRN